MDLTNLGKAAKKASRTLSHLSTQEKNQALMQMADSLEEQAEDILQANAQDVEQAAENGITGAMIDRLTLNADRVAKMAEGLRDISALPDPIGHVRKMWTNHAGLRIGQEVVPLGVIGIIYESRPNVTADAAGLCFKSGNAVILRGGKEAIHSNQAIVRALQQGLEQAGFPKEAIQLITDTSRDSAKALMTCHEYVDVLIPRGGAGLIRAVVEQATVPVIETGTGNCHIYVDDAAQIQMASDIVVNAKVTKPAACNAVETVLVHESVASVFLPLLEEALKPYQVELRADEAAQSWLSEAIPATEEDWETEFLDFILAVKVVKDLDEALDHIHKYSTHHSEAIITDNYFASQRFLREVDSAAVYINASTRFTDGMEFGFGAEIGISTQKLHARGPMGLPELTTIKTIVYGEGQTRG